MSSYLKRDLYLDINFNKECLYMEREEYITYE